MNNAIKLMEFINDKPICDEEKQAGIFIGNGSYSKLTTQQLQDIQYWLNEFNAQPQLEPFDYCLTYSKVLKTTASGVFCYLPER